MATWPGCTCPCQCSAQNTDRICVCTCRCGAARRGMELRNQQAERDPYYRAEQRRQEVARCLGLWNQRDRSNGYNPNCNCPECKDAKLDYWGGT